MNSENSSSRCGSKWEREERERGGEERLVQRKVDPGFEAEFYSQTSSLALLQDNELSTSEDAFAQ